MRILLASSEVHPYSKTGGLADMVAALGKTLASLGHEVGIVTPLYRGIREKVPALAAAELFPIEIPMALRRVRGSIARIAPQSGLSIYFVDQPGYYDRAGLYLQNGVDYSDNAERFLFLSKVVVRLAQDLPGPIDVVHVHDWQVGFVPLLIRHARRAGQGTAMPASLCTIHNLAYQGVFPSNAYELTNLPWEYFVPEGAEFYGQVNCLKTGLVYADRLTTVSPRYAREITTEAFGCGLDGVLRARQADLTGILNGVDYSEWNTDHNPFLVKPYSVVDLAGKAENKAALQQEMGLPIEPRIPLFASVTRLADQKGVDIELASLEEMLAADMQFVLLGSGSAEFEEGFRRLAQRHPMKAAVRLKFDHALSHRIEAGADFFLMPSRFEPCGLNQMYSLRYGTIPIVRVTGGLDDSVVDVSENWEEADGIKFIEYSSRALTKAIRKALVLYESPELLHHYQENGMRKDLSWETIAAEYVRLYESVLETAKVTSPTQSLEPMRSSVV